MIRRMTPEVIEAIMMMVFVERVWGSEWGGLGGDAVGSALYVGGLIGGMLVFGDVM
jgi:hypothetical protein